MAVRIVRTVRTKESKGNGRTAGCSLRLTSRNETYTVAEQSWRGAPCVRFPHGYNNPMLPPEIRAFTRCSIMWRARRVKTHPRKRRGLSRTARWGEPQSPLIAPALRGRLRGRCPLFCIRAFAIASAHLVRAPRHNVGPRGSRSCSRSGLSVTFSRLSTLARADKSSRASPFACR